MQQLPIKKMKPLAEPAGFKEQVKPIPFKEAEQAKVFPSSLKPADKKPIKEKPLSVDELKTMAKNYKFMELFGGQAHKLKKQYEDTVPKPVVKKETDYAAKKPWTATWKEGKATYEPKVTLVPIKEPFDIKMEVNKSLHEAAYEVVVHMPAMYVKAMVPMQAIHGLQENEAKQVIQQHVNEGLVGVVNNFQKECKQQMIEVKL